MLASKLNGAKMTNYKSFVAVFLSCFFLISSANAQKMNIANTENILKNWNHEGITREGNRVLEVLSPGKNAKESFGVESVINPKYTQKGFMDSFLAQLKASNPKDEIVIFDKSENEIVFLKSDPTKPETMIVRWVVTGEVFQNLSYRNVIGPLSDEDRAAWVKLLKSIKFREYNVYAAVNPHLDQQRWIQQSSTALVQSGAFTDGYYLKDENPNEWSEMVHVRFIPYGNDVRSFEDYFFKLRKLFLAPQHTTVTINGKDTYEMHKKAHWETVEMNAHERIIKARVENEQFLKKGVSEVSIVRLVDTKEGVYQYNYRTLLKAGDDIDYVKAHEWIDNLKRFEIIK